MAQQVYRSVPSGSRTTKGGREGVRDVHVPFPGPNQVVAVERDERVVDLLILIGENDVLDGDRPASIHEGPQDSLEHVGLSGRPARVPPRLERGVGELLSRLDLKGGHRRLSHLVLRYSL